MLCCFENRKNNSLEIFHHIFIGETQHAIPTGCEPSVAPFIVTDALFEIVAFAIDLNDEFAGMGDEICDVVAQGGLTAKG